MSAKRELEKSVAEVQHLASWISEAVACDDHDELRSLAMNLVSQAQAAEDAVGDLLAETEETTDGR